MKQTKNSFRYYKMKKAKKTSRKRKLTIFDKDVSFKRIERIILILTFIVTLVTNILIPAYNYFTNKPEYSFVLNNPVGWSKNDDIFSIYNYSDTDMKDTTVYIRSYMVLSGDSNWDRFDDYLFSDSKYIPMEGLDMRFQLTGKSRGKIGNITMDKESNPLSNYFVNNNYAEFGPNLGTDIISRIHDKNLSDYAKDYNTVFDKMNIVIFTIFDENTNSFNRNYNKIQVYATDYSVGKSGTKLVDSKKYFDKYDNSEDYAVYYNKDTYDKFWNDKDITITYYNKFIDEIINDSLPDNKKYNY